MNLSRRELTDYTKRNVYAQMMFGQGGDDYVASRCLVLHFLMPGWPLFAQAIEKLLKAIIFLETGAKSGLKGPNRHNPFLLKQELQSRADYDLGRYDGLLKRLHGHFQSRYFDNTDQSQRKSGNEIDEFDELWVHLLDRIPFPIEVKFRLSFFAMLCDPHIVAQLPSYRLWATQQNKPLAAKMEELDETYLAVLTYIRGLK